MKRQVACFGVHRINCEQTTSIPSQVGRGYFLRIQKTDKRHSFPKWQNDGRILHVAGHAWDYWVLAGEKINMCP